MRTRDIKMDKFLEKCLAETGNRERANETGLPMYGGYGRGGGRDTRIAVEANFESALCGALLKMRGESTGEDRRRLTGQLQDPSRPVRWLKRWIGSGQSIPL